MFNVAKCTTPSSGLAAVQMERRLDRVLLYGACFIWYTQSIVFVYPIILICLFPLPNLTGPSLLRPSTPPPTHTHDIQNSRSFQVAVRQAGLDEKRARANQKVAPVTATPVVTDQGAVARTAAAAKAALVASKKDVLTEEQKQKRDSERQAASAQAAAAVAVASKEEEARRLELLAAEQERLQELEEEAAAAAEEEELAALEAATAAAEAEIEKEEAARAEQEGAKARGLPDMQGSPHRVAGTVHGAGLASPPGAGFSAWPGAGRSASPSSSSTASPLRSGASILEGVIAGEGVGLGSINNTSAMSEQDKAKEAAVAAAKAAIAAVEAITGIKVPHDAIPGINGTVVAAAEAASATHSNLASPVPSTVSSVGTGSGLAGSDATATTAISATTGRGIDMSDKSELAFSIAPSSTVSGARDKVGAGAVGGAQVDPKKAAATRREEAVAALAAAEAAAEQEEEEYTKKIRAAEEERRKVREERMKVSVLYYYK